MQSIIATLALTAPLLALAAPPKYIAKNYTSGFEYDGGDGAILSAPVPGPYAGLQWNLEVGPFTYASGYCIEVCPTTFPVYVQFNVTDPRKSASVSTAYKGSKVVDFALNKFDFGCIAPAHYGPSGFIYDVPANCTLTVHGFKTAATAGAKPDVSATFKYLPVIGSAPNTGAPYAQMTSAELPATFKGLKYVTFNGTLLRGENKTYYTAAPIVRLDTFHYITRNLTKTG